MLSLPFDATLHISATLRRGLAIRDLCAGLALVSCSQVARTYDAIHPEYCRRTLLEVFGCSLKVSIPSVPHMLDATDKERSETIC